MDPTNILNGLTAYYMNGPIQDTIQIEINGNGLRYNNISRLAADRAFRLAARHDFDQLKADGKISDSEQLRLARVTAPLHGVLGYIGSQWLLGTAERNGMQLSDINTRRRRYMRTEELRIMSRRMAEAVTINVKPGYFSAPEPGEIDFSRNDKLGALMVELNKLRIAKTIENLQP